MFQQVTENIKISVRTKYNGMVAHNHTNYHAFSYFISIENNSKETVQLLERFWTIFDALNEIEFVAGEGVVGQKPIIRPTEEYNYQSNCFLVASHGAMSGSYKMIKSNTLEEIFVTIPTFQLNAKPSLN